VSIRDAEQSLLEMTARAYLQEIDTLKLSAANYEQGFETKPRFMACASAMPTDGQRLMEGRIEVVSADVPE